MIKRFLQFLVMDYSFTGKIGAYNYSYLRDYEKYCRENHMEPDTERFPHYYYWSNEAKGWFCVFVLAFIGSIVLPICRPELFTKIPTSYILASLRGAAIGLAIFSLITVNYFDARVIRHENAILIRFRSKKTVEQFERRYEDLVAYIEPYRESEKRKKAEADRQTQLEREEKRRQKEQVRQFYRKKFQVLLEYVETTYKVSTPDPDKSAKQFTIVLPDKDSTNTSECCFDLNETGLKLAIAQIANLDYVMRKRIELERMIDSVK